MDKVHANRVAAHLNRYLVETEKKYAVEFPVSSASDAFLASLDVMALDCREELTGCKDSGQMLKVIRGHYTRFAVGCKNDKRAVQPQPTNSPKSPATP